MKSRICLLSSIVLLAASFSTDDASAADRRWRFRQQSQPAPRPLENRPTTIIPTRQEIAAVPPAGQGRLVGYAVSLYPTARLARIVLGR